MRYIVESGPSVVGRLLTTTTRATLRHALHVACQSGVPHLPWPYEAVEAAARLVPSRAQRKIIHLPNTTAEIIRAPEVQERTGRVILYCHGGAFLVCGTGTHSGLITRLSRYADAPVLSVNYRMIPDYSVSDAAQDCIDAYYWLREHYEAAQIALAGDSAGGYLAMAVSNCLRLDRPAALALISPLLQLDPEPRKRHPNIRSDAMFGAAAFDTLVALIQRANRGVLYEPLENLDSPPPTLIHVSGDEALLHDAHLAADLLHDLGVPVELRVWPGQIHVFQIAPFVPESNRSLEQMGRFIIECTDIRHCNEIGLTYRTSAVV